MYKEVYLGDGQYYRGEVDERGVPNGHGRATVRGGEIEGNFRDGRPHGRVCMHRSDGSVVEGDYNVDSGFSGDVKIRYEDGSTYSGGYSDYYHGYHGNGKLVQRNGLVFEGMFQEGHFYRGTLSRKDGTRYTGYFNRGDQFHGLGELCLPNGVRIKGEFRHDVPREGTLTTPEGDIYTGCFDDDGKMHGDFVIVRKDGTRSECRFEHGKPTTDGLRSPLGAGSASTTSSAASQSAAARAQVLKQQALSKAAKERQKEESARFRAKGNPLVGVLIILAILAIDIVLTLGLKDVSGLCRWLWLPLCTLVWAALGTGAMSFFPRWTAMIYLVLYGIVWGLVRPVLVVAAYFSAVSGWGIALAVLLCVFMFLLNGMGCWASGFLAINDN